MCGISGGDSLNADWWVQMSMINDLQDHLFPDHGVEAGRVTKFLVPRRLPADS
jgi:hypothetical protein